MATFKATFFSNRRRKDGTYSIKIRITHNRKSRYIPTSLYATDRDITKGMKIKDETIRLAVEDQILQFRKICNEVGPAIESMDVDQVIDFLMSPKCGFDLDFISYGREVIQKMKTAGQTGNAKVYNIALKSLSNYVNGRSLSIHEISARFVREYIDYLEGSRAKSLYPATLRAIHNRAKEEFNDEDRGIVNIPYSPFSRLKMKAPVAKKRAISLERIQYIIGMPYVPDKFLTPGHYNRINFAKDIFVLSFALMGMNVADLFECSKYEDGRIIYERKKTRSRRADRALMSVNIPDPVRNIFEKYRDKSGKKVFEFYTHYSSADTMSYNINKALKSIGKEIGAIDLEMYAARHTFASLARNECGFSIDKVAQALNHVEAEHKVTDLYIKKDWSTIDQVQDKVLELFDWTAL